jgi:hypothetical protein
MDCWKLENPFEEQNIQSSEMFRGLLEHVLQQGAPEVVPSGARFALDVYGLESTLEMEGDAGWEDPWFRKCWMKLQNQGFWKGSIMIYALFISIDL